MILDHFAFLGLYSYLRQLELSLDRVLSEKNALNLNKYLFLYKYNPNLVYIHFDNLLKSDNTSSILHMVKHLFYDSIINVNSSFFIRNKNLREICNLILEYNYVISKDYTEINTLISIRMKINRINELFLGKKINKNLKKALDNVEHYNQSKYLQLASIDEIIGKEWIVQ